MRLPPTACLSSNKASSPCPLHCPQSLTLLPLSGRHLHLPLPGPSLPSPAILLTPCRATKPPFQAPLSASGLQGSFAKSQSLRQGLSPPAHHLLFLACLQCLPTHSPPQGHSTPGFWSNFLKMQILPFSGLCSYSSSWLGSFKAGRKSRLPSGCSSGLLRWN